MYARFFIISFYFVLLECQISELLIVYFKFLNTADWINKNYHIYFKLAYELFLISYYI